ncbi:MAG: FG-GAP-like repeat-containing protein, partial [Candidatus Margulisbacteria bacterium]|nr:FG-GAP-like repeat-containing protein [Candidatus Margulisiibacteriota bacterium]
MLINVKKYFLFAVFIAVSLTMLRAAGTYIQVKYNYYDVLPAKQPDSTTGNLQISKHIFSSTMATGNVAGLIGNTGAPKMKLLYPSVINYMSTDSSSQYIVYDAENTTYKANHYELQEVNYRIDGHRLLPGYPATNLNKTSEAMLGLVYDLYPGRANVINTENVYIAFKVYAKQNTAGEFEKPFLDFGRLTVEISVDNMGYTNTRNYFSHYGVSRDASDASGFKLVPTTNTGSESSHDNIWSSRIAPSLNEGQSYGVTFFPESDVALLAGAKVTVRITVPYAELDGLAESLDFTFMIEGMPFIQKIVSNNTEIGIDNVDNMLESQLYGWTADGGQDINGDGYPDLVIGDPYFRYTSTNLEKKTGRVYVYFGGPDKILNDRISPDIIIDNPTTASESAGNDREFGYKVKLADINNDGYADIVVGQPSWGTGPSAANQGRILVYFGGPQYPDGTLMMNVVKQDDGIYHARPSLEIQNSGGTGTGDPELDDLFGERFDTGDIDGDGYADIVAKIGNTPGYANHIYIFSGKDIAQGFEFNKLRLYIGDDTVSITVVDREGNKHKTGIQGVPESRVAVIGYANEDDKADFAVSYPNSMEGRNSSVGLFFGGKAIGNYNREAPDVSISDASDNSGYIGMSLAGADVNGDGLSDVVIGKLTTDTGNQKGKVLIFLSRPGMCGPYVYVSENPNDDGSSHGIMVINDPMPSLDPSYRNSDTSGQFGLEVANAGDLDDDGADDIMIGAPYYGDSEIGAVYLVMGARDPLGNLIDTQIQEDNLREYVITGPFAHAHYGRTIAALGDFDQNGQDDVLISGPGFYGDRFFGGYPLPSGTKNPLKDHVIDIYSNTQITDKALPVAVFSQINPQNTLVGWDELTDTLNIMIYDRGNAGLEFDSLSIAFTNRDETNLNNYLPGGTPLVAKKEMGGFAGSTGESQVGNNFQLTSFWMAENNWRAATDNSLLDASNLKSLTNYYNSDYVKGNNGIIINNQPYAFGKSPSFINVGFSALKSIMDPSGEYSLRLRFSDRGLETHQSINGFHERRETVVTLDIVVNEQKLATISDSNSDSVSGSVFTGILDLNEDDMPEFA